MIKSRAAGRHALPGAKYEKEAAKKGQNLEGFWLVYN